MRRLLGILVFSCMALVAFNLQAGEPAKETRPAESSTVGKPSQDERIPHDFDGMEFAPDGFARDVMNLMTGLSHPLDDSTNLTVQAGKGFRIGLTF